MSLEGFQNHKVCSVQIIIKHIEHIDTIYKHELIKEKIRKMKIILFYANAPTWKRFFIIH